MVSVANYPPRVSRAEASTYLKAQFGISRTAATLAKLACVGGGPKYRRVGKRAVVYDLAELDAWAEKQISGLVTNSSSCNWT